jgi:hypothetical protein
MLLFKQLFTFFKFCFSIIWGSDHTFLCRNHNTSFSYEWFQKARVSHNIRLEKLAMDKHSSLLGLFVSYEENRML